MQLKSTQEQPALDNISSIIKTIGRDFCYRVRGHEVHQVSAVMRRVPLEERAKTVARFCRQNELTHLTYHAPILGLGDNIWNRGDVVKESVRQTVQEAQLACKEAGIKEKAVIVFHLTSYVPSGRIPSTAQEKTRLVDKAVQEFLDFFAGLDTQQCIMAVENTYPRFRGGSSTIGPFHPQEVARIASKGGIAATLDLAHYHLYSNYIRHGKGNLAGDIDRQLFGAPPGWQECIRMLGGSLVQLHISDARGMEVEGEALPLGQGDIPLAEILTFVNSSGRDVRGTLELGGGHLNGARLQLEGARWLLENVREIF
ncbi:MAG: TIM barrel protein [Nitrososphaera sp.]|jgi:sugar phosphate isomerase/epimerase